MVPKFIAENMLKSFNNESFHEDLLHLIVDIRFCKNTVKDGFIYNRKGERVLRKSMRGINLLCVVKSGQNEDEFDRSMNLWHPLKELKESYPFQVAKFAVARAIDKIPAFAWWVNYTLKKRDTIITSMRQRIAKTTHKYGIEIPTS